MLPPSSKKSLASDFANTFNLQIASTDAERARVYGLRYRVFCQEMGCTLDEANGLEADHYDEHSLNCLLENAHTGLLVGCIRLVQPLARGGGLPFENYAIRHVDRKLLDWRQLDPGNCCEISRLALEPSYRRRLRDGTLAERSFAPATSKIFSLPFIALALYQAAVALVLDRGYEMAFMVGEPRLQRHLSSYGILMRQVSPVFDHFGERAVFVVNRASLLDTVATWNTERLQYFHAVQEKLEIESDQQRVLITSA
jgi:N-acyl amino acid synthase of PEP-CTERM/exosortase system